MLYHHDPDEWETVTASHMCPYHQEHGSSAIYAGCTCHFSSGLRRRDPAEVAKIKAQKLREHEDRILAEAEAIRARRAIA